MCLRCLARDCNHVIPERVFILTGREQEVIFAVSEGDPLKHVAWRLGISQGTLKSHLTHIYRKLNLRGGGSIRKLQIWSVEHRDVLRPAA